MFEHPSEVPSQLGKGQHAKMFTYNNMLYAELDGWAIERVKAVNKEDLAALVALLQSWEQDWKKLCASSPVVAWAAKQAVQKLPKFILTKLGITATQALQVLVVFAIIEAVILAIRAAEINHAHINGADGGVIIQFIFPNFQIQSIIEPRGGWKSQPALEKAAAFGSKAKGKIQGIGQKIGSKIASLRA